MNCIKIDLKRDLFFESTNTPLETWIFVLDSWIKEHQLQVQALTEKKTFII